MTLQRIFRTYYYLTKPGIVYGNAITATAGYFFGAHGKLELLIFASMLIGICLVMASACVFNNVMDRDTDARMERTKKRAISTGNVSVRNALLFASILLVVGLGVLLIGTNILTVLVAIGGHVAYVVIYGIAKRKTVHGTLVGTISGSTPPVIGYVAATAMLDPTALILFLILVAWQMPHFYSIAIFRRDDYKNAGIPVLPVVSGLEATRRQIIAYVVLFIIACFALSVYGEASLLWVLIMVLVGSYWLYLCLQPMPEGNDVNRWARRQFGWSLMVLLIMSVGLSLDSFWH